MMKVPKRIKTLIIAVGFMVTSWVAAAVPWAYAADFTGKKIAGISITGNNTVAADRIVSVLKLKAGDILSDAALQEDMQAIYELNEFYDVQANFIEVPEGIRVVYAVTEKMPVKDVVFVGNSIISSAKLQELVASVKGSTVDRKTLAEKSQAIGQYYHDQGYLLAKVTNMAMNQEGIITVSINEGLVEAISVKGNVKTKTAVIIREVNLKPQEPFNAKTAKRSMQKIYNLGFFEDVNVKLNPGKEPNGVEVEIDVVEKKTGTFSVGGGYSGTYGLAATVGLGDTNFRGSGNNLNVSFQHSFDDTLGTSWQLNFTNPYIDDKKTSLSVSVFNTVGEYSDYGLDGDNTTLRSTYYRRSRGINVTLGRPQGEYIRNYLTLTKRKDSYLEYVSGPVNYLADSSDTEYYNEAYNSAYVRNNFGEIHSATLARVYDTRDNVFEPTEGERISLSGEFAGRGLGGEFDFNKYNFEGRKYFKVGSKQTLGLRVAAGSATGDVPDASQFTVGGIDTLRGYEDDEFKGKKMFMATVEYRYPIAKKIQGVFFSDAGNAWNGGYNLSDLHYSVGTGLRVDTPVGPVRIDYGYGSEGGKVHFSFGGTF
ncbi:MAG TPA: BamA/TamA family outer membrane protein [Sporomusa sp.]|nr:BamA/TamA family outer membrane protein [Sporomusa sp.]HWR06752.1 BamA/TamA family outer membrane protein [Sporomusa sp.]